MDLLNTIVDESPRGYALAIEVLENEIKSYEYEMNSGELDDEHHDKRYQQVKDLDEVIDMLRIRAVKLTEVNRANILGFKLSITE